MNEKKMKYLIASIIVIIVIMASIYYLVTPELSGDTDIEDPGAIEMKVGVDITKIDADTGQTEDIATGNFVIDGIEDVPPKLPIQPKPEIALSISEVGVPFVEPTAQYSISFSITATVTPQSPAVTHVDLTGSSFGQTADDITFNYWTGKGYYWPPTVQDTKSNQPVGSIDVELPPFFKVNEQEDGTGTEDWVLGSYIHDSEFRIYVDAVSVDDASVYGSTYVDIILKVGSGGSIGVQITDVGVVPIP